MVIVRLKKLRKWVKNNMRNTVELIGYYGNDELIASCAWTSTSRDIDDKKRDRIPKLIQMLASEGHHTPFERGILHFLLHVDDKTHIHLLKHRISSINGESARYKEIKHDNYLIPPDLPFYWQDKLKEHSDKGNELYHECLNALVMNNGFDRKRAKEVSRYFKTQNSQLTLDFQINFRSFMNFQKLRNSEHAQKEIQEISQQMLSLVKNIDGNPFKYSIESFGL